jgi:hypothetical protein
VQVMLPGAQLASATPRPKEGAIQVRWIVGPASAALEIDGQRVWAGANDLSGDEPRFVGVRFLVHTDAGGEAAIETVDVKTKN